MKERLIRLLWLAPTLISLAYFAFWACAPAAYLAPPLAADGPRGLVGIAAVYSHENFTTTEDTIRPDGLDGQVWFQRRFKRVGFGLQAAAGQSAYLGGGASFQVHVLDRPRFRLAADVQGGVFYAGMALPMVTNLTPELEWYVAPWASFRAGKVLRLPTGLRYWIPDGPMLSVEAGGAALTDTGDFDQYEVWGAAAVGFPLLRP